MFAGVLVSIFVLASPTHQFAPDNSLHLEDTLEKSSAGEEVFNEIIDVARDLYLPYAEERGERLIFNKRWEDSTVNASMSRSWGTVSVNMYGGLYRRPEVTPEAFALVVCHELGHAYGGVPYLRSSSKISAEGQADYYGAGECLKKVMAVVEVSHEASSMELPYADAVCDNGDCIRGLKAGLGLGTLLQVLMEQPPLSYETPDQTIVTRTELSYPRTAQCRLDTYRAGTLDQPRPACWFKQD